MPASASPRSIATGPTPRPWPWRPSSRRPHRRRRQAAHAAPLDALRAQLAAIAAAFAERTGRNVKAMIAASQGETELAKAFRNQFIAASRADGRALLERAIRAGELRADLDLEVTLDLVYGPLYYRLLVGHAPLDRRFTDALLDQAAARPRALTRSAKAKGPPAGADGPRRFDCRPGQPSTSTDPRTGAGTSTSLCSEEPGVAPEPLEPASPVPPGAAWVRREPARAPALVEPLIPFNQRGRDGATCPSARPWCGADGSPRTARSIESLVAS